MNKKHGLGRGLEALIPREAGEPSASMREIPVDQISPGPSQLRFSLDEEKLDELAGSIKELGVVQPVVVRPLPGGGFELVAGERRWQACRKIGLSTIPAIIRSSSDVEAAAMALIENIQRENLNALEEADAYRRLVEEFGLTQEEVARQVGKSRPLVGNMIRLLALPGQVKNMIIQGKISAGHGRAILALSDPKLMLAAAEQMVKRGMNVREAEEYVKRLIQEKAQNKVARNKPDPFFKNMEDSLTKRFNSKVRIREEKGGGMRLEISFDERELLCRWVEVLLSPDLEGDSG